MRKAIQGSAGLTWQRIRQHIQPRAGLEGLPPDSDLVVGLVGRGRFKEGRRTLRVLFSKEGQEGSAPFHQQEIDFSRLGGKDTPVIARLTLGIGSLKIDGAGIYHFDFLLENQFVGRLPLVIFSDQAGSGRVNRGPLRNSPVDLEFGHVVQGIDPPKPHDPEYAFTLQGVVDGIGIREPSPFRLPGLMLIIGVSAPEGQAVGHMVSVQFQGAQGNLLSAPVEETIDWQPFLPGGLFAMRGFQLENLVCPGAGLYEFHVAADGRPIGHILFPVSLVPGE